MIRTQVQSDISRPSIILNLRHEHGTAADIEDDKVYYGTFFVGQKFKGCQLKVEGKAGAGN